MFQYENSEVERLAIKVGARINVLVACWFVLNIDNKGKSLSPLRVKGGGESCYKMVTCAYQGVRAKNVYEYISKEALRPFCSHPKINKKCNMIVNQWLIINKK